MSQAYIYCPKSKKDIYVGLNLEWSQLDSLEPPVREITPPRRGETHRFSKQDVIPRADDAGD